MTFIPPIDAALELQASVTKTASFNGAALNLGDGYAPGGLGAIVAAVIDVTAIDTTSGNETYAFKLQQSADGSTNWTDIGPSVSATAVGVIIAKGIVTTENIRLVLTAGGTTPSITYSANGAMS